MSAKPYTIALLGSEGDAYLHIHLEESALAVIKQIASIEPKVDGEYHPIMKIYQDFVAS